MDFLGKSLLTTGYEDAEHHLADRFLKPGMTVLDIGAHRGFHTVFFSKKVGPAGRVLAFEPSPDDCDRLRLHLRINRCHNIQVFAFALGNQEGFAEIYVNPGNTVLNSLRRRPETQSVEPLTVYVRRLDDVLQDAHAQQVDFVKLDVEGGERDVLNGAQSFLQRTPRPLILCEVLDEVTQLWGYSSRTLFEYLASLGFRWYSLNAAGQLMPALSRQGQPRGNLLAVPSERVGAIAPLLAREEATKGASQ